MTVVKRVVVRTRSYVLAEEGRYETGWLGAIDGPHSSFPSGHTADAVAAARAIARVYPQARGPAYAAAAAVGAIQIPRSDCQTAELPSSSHEVCRQLAFPSPTLKADKSPSGLRVV